MTFAHTCDFESSKKLSWSLFTLIIDSRKWNHAKEYFNDYDDSWKWYYI